MAFMLKNSDGEEDGMYTWLVLSVLAVLFKFIIAGWAFVLGGATWNGGSIDAGVIAALLAPPYAAYVARRNNDKKIAGEAAKSQVVASTEIAKAQTAADSEIVKAKVFAASGTFPPVNKP